MATTTPVAPVLHRARNGNLMAFAVNGFALASWLARVPDVKEALDLTPGLLAILLLGISSGALIGLPLAGRLTHRLGAARTVRLGMMVEVPGLIVAAAAIQLKAPLWMAAVPLVLVGLGSGVWDVAMNLEGTVIEQGLGRAIMPWFHAAFSGGTVLGALIGAVIVFLKVPLLLHLGVVAVLVAVAAWWGTSDFLP
ncbi:MAG TPA: MFS transporter, partial [Propionibacteriaceae bacterium]|nr:MFS transporter [Propionibacteriaceae bacterium]